MITEQKSMVNKSFLILPNSSIISYSDHSQEQLNRRTTVQMAKGKLFL
jgi:hypothetical protein